MVLFIAEINRLDSWDVDIGNVYLEAFAKEKVCMIVGPKFGPLQCHMFLINKASCGLRTSGLRWYERLSD